ncbi:MAG TPA: DNA polymerase III subunit gamma/tau, partial [Amaricoccus sp.]|nr:DNA polymerase III subunit gamma/tau [Amaricoccus sp.]
IRKVPVTVLSRCQRFDLRRIEPETMLAHLGGIAAQEGAAVAPDALALIVRAAEGSVRDALSLMDQAIAHGAGETSAAEVRAMLGLADRGRVLDLFERIMAGEVAAALAELSAQYAAGADPLAILRDLAEVTHWVSMVKIAPEVADDPTIGPDERARGLDFAERLGMRALTRMWQMLLKALDEVGQAPNAMMAAEMAVIRLTHVADLPSPEDLIRRLSDAAPAAPGPAGGGGGGTRAGGAARAQAAPRPQAMARPAPETAALARYAAFEDVVALVRARRDMALLVEIETGVRLVKYAPGRIEFEPAPGAAPDLAARIAERLRTWTGARWGVSIVGSGGGATLAEREAERKGDLEGRARAHPLVQAMLAAFPGARIRDVRQPEPPALPAAEAEATGAEDDDDWDPFDPASEEN